MKTEQRSGSLLLVHLALNQPLDRLIAEVAIHLRQTPLVAHRSSVHKQEAPCLVVPLPVCLAQTKLHHLYLLHQSSVLHHPPHLEARYLLLELLLHRVLVILRLHHLGVSFYIETCQVHIFDQSILLWFNFLWYNVKPL